jgi:hypothetical protein
LLLAAAVADRADDSLQSSLFAGGLPAVISVPRVKLSTGARFVASIG